MSQARFVRMPALKRAPEDKRLGQVEYLLIDPQRRTLHEADSRIEPAGPLYDRNLGLRDFDLHEPSPHIVGDLVLWRDPVGGAWQSLTLMTEERTVLGPWRRNGFRTTPDTEVPTKRLTRVLREAGASQNDGRICRTLHLAQSRSGWDIAGRTGLSG